MIHQGQHESVISHLTELLIYFKFLSYILYSTVVLLLLKCVSASSSTCIYFNAAVLYLHKNYTPT